MINLTQFINESARSTNSNEERRIELEKWLKNKKYNEYVKVLDKMLDDPKAKTLLVDGFGGELGNTKFIYSVKRIPASNLRPTQSEIDVDKSLKMFLTNPENIKNDFKEDIVIANMPLVTFRGNYIIDGHHRWSEVAMINPSGKMVCFDYDADISPKGLNKVVSSFTITCNNPFKRLKNATIYHGFNYVQIVEPALIPTVPDEIIILVKANTNHIEVSNGKQTIKLSGTFKTDDKIIIKPEADYDKEAEIYLNSSSNLALLDLDSDFENFTVKENQTVTITPTGNDLTLKLRRLSL